MKVTRHGKPSKEYTATLKDPTKGDYDALVKAALTAIIEQEKDILVAFAYTLKFPDDFPRGVLMEKVDHKNIHRIKAKKLLEWLNKHGHTDITMASLIGQLVSFGKQMSKWEDDDGSEQEQEFSGSSN